MIIMKTDATEEEITAVINEITRFGLKAAISRGDFRTVIGLVGDERKIDFEHFNAQSGVKEAFAVEAQYKLINWEYNKHFKNKEQRFVIKTGNLEIGGDVPVYIAGPCAVESKDQLFEIAEGVKKAGAHILRGGIFKPRTSVHSFQGLGNDTEEEAREALGWLRDAGNRFELQTITEVRGEAQADLVAEYIDIMQIGSRNMYDQDLLAKVASKGKPVFYKRHFGASIEEFLSFTEYLAAEGNLNIILCERGILPIGKGKSYARYTLDLAAVPVIKKETYLPVMVDPSHAAGRRDLIAELSHASIAAGACGLMIESHYNPAEAIVDGQQMVTPDELKEIISTCNRIHKLIFGNTKTKATK